MNQITIDVKPRGIESAYIVAPFDKGKETLEKAEYRILSSEENARLRIQEGAKEYISQSGNWVKECGVYILDKGARLTKVPLVCENAEEATKCHRNGKDYYLNEEQIERVLADSVELDTKRLPKLDDGTSYIPTSELHNEKISTYAFGDIAEEYGRFLRGAGINKMPIWLAGLQDKPFVRQLWFCRLGVGGRSDLNCDYRNLHFGNIRVRGVKDSAEGTAKNFTSAETYTIAQIQEALKRRNILGIEQILINELKQ